MNYNIDELNSDINNEIRIYSIYRNLNRYRQWNEKVKTL